MIMARNEDGTYSQVGFVKDNAGIDTEYIYDKDGDIVFEKGFTRETSGTVPLTINGIGKDLKAWSITGNTVQNGTPTPENPVEVQAVGDRTGNLFDYKKYFESTFTEYNEYFEGAEIQLKPFTTYTFATSFGDVLISGTTVPETSFIITTSAEKPNTLTGGISSNRMGTKTKTTEQDGIIKIYKRIKGRNLPKKEDFDSGMHWLMINEGDTALSYEPYGYKIPVVTRGRNLFDYKTMYGVKDKYLNENGEILDSVGYWAITDYIPCSGTIFTINSIGGILPSVCLYDSHKNFITGLAYGTEGAEVKKPITIKSEINASYIRFSYCIMSKPGTSDDLSKIQIEEGTTATPYEPYHEPITTPIYLPTPLYSGEVLRSDGSREVKWGKIVLTGEEKIVATGATGTSYRYDFTNIKTISQIKYARKNSKITHFEQCDMPTIDVVGYDWHGSSFYLMIMTTQSTINKFKDWLKSQYEAGTPVTVWYQLATPTTETVTVPQIPTLNGTTVIDVDTAVKPTEMYTKYKSSK